MATTNELVFSKEIQTMMFGLGDCRTPLLATAAVIESVVRQQMTVLLLKTEEIAESRCSPHIEVQDILFVLRKDKTKLKRLLQFMEMKDTRMGMTRIMEDMDPVAGIGLQNKLQKSRKDSAVRYLLSIGIDEVSLNGLKDQAKMERLIRADQISQPLNEKSYMEFHKSRTCSFAATRMNQAKFLDWLKETSGGCIFKLRKDTVDILVYLAKEVVAELVDLALRVRQDVTALPGDPLSRAMDPLPINPNDTFGHKQNQMECPYPITPEEIREVVRRFMSNLLLPFSAFNCNTYTPLYNKLLIN